MESPFTKGRSTEIRRKRGNPDYYDETAATAATATAEEGLQGDAGEYFGIQGDDGDDEEEEEVIVAAVLKSVPEHVIARLGETVTFPCDVANSSGAVVMWEHGEEKLYQVSGGLTGKMAKDTKTILHSNWSIEIPSVSAEDAGEYRCTLITSKQPTPNVTHTLRLPTPPAIVEMWPQKEGRRVVEGSELRISCRVDGFPRPTLSWSRTVGERTQRVGAQEALFEPDSIVISNVQRHHAGKYFCMAENGVGSPAISSVAIQVLGKPRVHVHRAQVNAAVGLAAVIGCTVHDEPRSVITWMKGDNELTDSADVHVTHEYPTSTVRIAAVKEKDFGTYTCIARNTYGEHSKSAELVEEPVVEELSVVGESLVWQIHSHMQLKDVLLEYRRVDQPDADWQKVSVKPERTDEHHVYTARYPLRELPRGEYEAKSRARNERGWSASSRPLFLTAGVDEPNHENIQAAGVGTNLGGGAPHLKSTAPLIATLFTCLLIRLI